MSSQSGSPGASARDLDRRVGPNWCSWNWRQGGHYRWIGAETNWWRDRRKRKPKETK